VKLSNRYSQRIPHPGPYIDMASGILDRYDLEESAQR
jgi:hypothetical protein